MTTNGTSSGNCAGIATRRPGLRTSGSGDAPLAATSGATSSGASDGNSFKAFCLSATAHHAARTVGCSYPTAYRAYTECRLAMADLAAEEKRPLLGELELDESYFGGKRKGK